MCYITGSWWHMLMQVLSTDACDAIVKAAPETEADLAHVRSLPTLVIQEYGQVILQCLNQV